MGKRSRAAAIFSGAMVAIIGLIILYFLAVGGLLAFLWNSILVDTLHFTSYTLNLWTGLGAWLLLNIIGGAFRSVQNRN